MSLANVIRSPGSVADRPRARGVGLRLHVYGGSPVPHGKALNERKNVACLLCLKRVEDLGDELWYHHSLAAVDPPYDYIWCTPGHPLLDVAEVLGS